MQFVGSAGWVVQQNYEFINKDMKSTRLVSNYLSRIQPTSPFFLLPTSSHLCAMSSVSSRLSERWWIFTAFYIEQITSLVNNCSCFCRICNTIRQTVRSILPTAADDSAPLIRSIRKHALSPHIGYMLWARQHTTNIVYLIGVNWQYGVHRKYSTSTTTTIPSQATHMHWRHCSM